MDLGGIIGKIEGNADKLGAVLGALGGLSEFGKDWGTGAIGAGEEILKKLIEDPHIPDLGHVFYNMTYPTHKTFQTSIAAIILGWILESVDIVPNVDRLGRAMSKAGMGALWTYAGVNILAYAGAGHSDGADHGLRGGSHFPILSGSRHNPHGAYTERSVAPYGTNLTRSGNSSPSPYT